jgi:glyoxylase-like metal-dependent hydrolase (beta-lactamase superfamily II)
MVTLTQATIARLIDSRHLCGRAAIGPAITAESFRPEIVSSHPRVVMFTAPNPGPKTLEGTHTFVVGHAPAYVIDPGPESEVYVTALSRWLSETGRQVNGILLSHSHPDHAPGARLLRALLGAPIWASPETAADLADALGVDHRFDGRAFPVEGDELRIFPSPGHTLDHVGFWLPLSRLLFAGDVILGQGSTVVMPPEGDMALYMHSLASMRELQPTLIAPGHGPMIFDPIPKIDEYLAHRRQREEQILETLGRGPNTVEGLVSQIYIDVAPELKELAGGSVAAQLQKLEKEGRVDRDGDHFALPR